jgi:transposase
MRQKRGELQQALTGRITSHHRFLLKQHMEHIEYLEKAIASLVVEIERQAAPFATTIARWKSIPGVEELAAFGLLTFA